MKHIGLHARDSTCTYIIEAAAGAFNFYGTDSTVYLAMHPAPMH